MIKLFACDLDGTLTDGRYLVAENGDIIKSFYCRDYEGLRSLANRDIPVVILTRSGEGLMGEYFKHLGNVTIFAGIKDKKFQMEEILRENKLSWEEVSYIGDDTNDIELLQNVGLAACPQDAIEEVKEVVMSMDNGWVIPKEGGRGAVRYFSEIVLKILDSEILLEG